MKRSVMKFWPVSSNHHQKTLKIWFNFIPEVSRLVVIFEICYITRKASALLGDETAKRSIS